MEKEELFQGQPDIAGAASAAEDSSLEEATHEVTQRAQSVLELSKELTSSSKALLEQIEPIV